MPDIVITITMPDDGPALLVMQRGDLAVTHTYSGGVPGTHNDKHALEAAYDKLTALEADPPDVPEPPQPKRPAKAKAKADAEPTIDIPLKKGTRSVPISRVTITGGESDAAAYQQALAIAGRLIDGGLWDGEQPIQFADVYATARKIKRLRDNDLVLFTLDELLNPTGTSQPPLVPEPPAEVQPAVTLQPGQIVTWAAGTCDVDGDPVPFERGRIVEIDGSAAWVERPDGTDDVWVSLDALQPSDNLTYL